MNSKERNFQITARQKARILPRALEWRNEMLAQPHLKYGDYIYIDQLELPGFQKIIPRREWLVYAFTVFDIFQKELPPLQDFIPYLRIELACTKFKRLIGSSLAYRWVRNRLSLTNPPKIFYTLTPASHLLEFKPVSPQSDWNFLLKKLAPVVLFYKDFYEEIGKDFSTDIIAVPIDNLPTSGEDGTNIPAGAGKAATGLG